MKNNIFIESFEDVKAFPDSVPEWDLPETISLTSAIVNLYQLKCLAKDAKQNKYLPQGKVGDTTLFRENGDRSVIRIINRLAGINTRKTFSTCINI